MPIVSLPSVITNAPLSGACRARASRYIRKCMEISEWSFHSNRFDFVVLRNLVDHVLSLGDLSENGVDSVKVRLGSMTDEELAAAGVLPGVGHGQRPRDVLVEDRKSTRLNSSHTVISYAVFCLKKKKKTHKTTEH